MTDEKDIKRIAKALERIAVSSEKTEDYLSGILDRLEAIRQEIVN